MEIIFKQNYVNSTSIFFYYTKTDANAVHEGTLEMEVVAATERKQRSSFERNSNVYSSSNSTYASTTT